MWCRHNHFFGRRNQFMDVHRNIPCSRWKVKQQKIQIAPFDFFEKAVQHFPEHWSSADDWGIIFYKEAHGDNLYTETFDRNDLFAADLRSVLNTHHIRYAESINIRINNTDFFAEPH